MTSSDSDTRDPNGSSEAHYIELLGLAYEVPLQNRAFETFLDDAHDFFAVNLETGELSDAIIQNDAAQRELDAHSNRLAQAFDLAIATEKEQAAAPHTYHAVLQIDCNTLQVAGNDAAAVLLKCTFPMALDSLPLDFTARQQIRRALVEPNVQDRIFLAAVGEDEEQACLGLIQRSQEGPEAITISLSFVHWSDTLLRRLGNAFGLTDTETQVLAGYLKNKTPKEIADARGRSPETVKAQSKSILRKAGCARIADVVQLSAGLAYMLRQMPDQDQADFFDSWATPTEHLTTFKRGRRTVGYYTYGSGRRVIVFLHALIQGPFFHESFLDRLDAHDTMVLAPSRPAYGHTSAPPTDSAFNETALQDALAVIERHTEGEVHLVAHQLGTSHAVRLANALGPRAASLILINGGVPLRREYFDGMDRRVRFAAMSARYAPAVLKLTNALGLRNFRKRGVRLFIVDRYRKSPIDMKALHQPGVMEFHALGCFHSCEQGGAPYLLDELSKHADWSDDLKAVPCPQYWLQPENCQIVTAENVRRVTDSLPNAQYTLEPNCGSILLYERPLRIADFVLSSMDDALSKKR